MDAGTIVALAHSSENTSAFEQTFLDELMRHIGADVAAFRVGVGVGVSGSPAVRGFDPRILADWDTARARHASELGPVLAAAAAGASVDIHLLGERRVRSTRYFSEVVRPHGGRETLYAVPMWRARPTGCLLLGRTGPRGRFHLRDVRAVNALLPAIAVASAAVEAAARRRVAPPLTRRETEIVDLIRRGLRSGEIAAQLGTSVNTVRNQTWRLMARLGVATRAELIAVCAGSDA